jgi:hypothetical protein
MANAYHRATDHGLPRYDPVELLLIASSIVVLTVVALVAF